MWDRRRYGNQGVANAPAGGGSDGGEIADPQVVIIRGGMPSICDEDAPPVGESEDLGIDELTAGKIT
jgi:hypothetical protein